jgi:ATP-dependent DNA helicase RecG
MMAMVKVNSTMSQLEFDFEDAERRAIPHLWRVDEIFADAGSDILHQFHEDDRIERKPAGMHAEAFAIYVCMWANTPPDGGIIAVGVEDDGRITGCSAKAEALTEIERRIRCEMVPDARLQTKKLIAKTVDGTTDFILLWWVHFREDKVVETNKGEAWIRIASSKHQLTDTEKEQLRIERGQTSFELEPCNLSWPGDFDEAAIASWVREVYKAKGLKSTDPHHNVLARHHLGKMQQGKFIPNNASALLFANDPQTVIPGCMLRFQRIDGRELKTGAERNVVTNVTITGTVPRIIIEAHKLIETQVRTYGRLGNDGRFYAAPEYPYEAWQEAVVNACVHRSYSLRGANIFVRMYDDHFEVESPGGFPGLVTEETIYEASHYRRNWWLMDAMQFMQFVLCENEGVKRIRQSMIDLGLPEPKFEQKQVAGAVVRVTLRNNRDLRTVWVYADVADIIGSEKAASLNDYERRIVNFAAEHGKINISQAMNLMTKPRWHTAKRYLDKLVADEVFQHVTRYRQDPTGYYCLLTPEDKTKTVAPLV